MRYLPQPPQANTINKSRKIIGIVLIVSALIVGIFAGRATKQQKECKQPSMFTADRDSCIVSSGLISCIVK